MKQATLRCVSRAPCRVDFAGGSTDIWPLYLHLGGVVLVHAAVDLYAEAELSWEKTKSPVTLEIISEDLGESRQYDGISQLRASLNESIESHPCRWLARLAYSYLSEGADLKTGHWRLICRSKVPPGSGLGGSSVMGVAVARAFLHILCRLPESEKPWITQERLRNLEAAEMKFPAGEQDYIPALFGGFLVSHLGAEAKNAERLSSSVAKELLNRCLLIYTGKPHHSGLNNWDIYYRFHQGEEALRQNLEKISLTAEAMARELKGSNLDNFAALLGQEWGLRQKLSSKVNAEVLESAWNFAQKLGASACKACGAGGGGSLLVYFKDPDLARAALKHKLPDESWMWMNCGLSEGPSIDTL